MVQRNVQEDQLETKDIMAITKEGNNSVKTYNKDKLREVAHWAKESFVLGVQEQSSKEVKGEDSIKMIKVYVDGQEGAKEEDMLQTGQTEQAIANYELISFVIGPCAGVVQPGGEHQLGDGRGGQQVQHGRQTGVEYALLQGGNYWKLEDLQHGER